MTSGLPALPIANMRPALITPSCMIKVLLAPLCFELHPKSQTLNSNPKPQTLESGDPGSAVATSLSPQLQIVKAYRHARGDALHDVGVARLADREDAPGLDPDVAFEHPLFVLCFVFRVWYFALRVSCIVFQVSCFNL